MSSQKTGHGLKQELFLMGNLYLQVIRVGISMSSEAW